MQRLVVYDSMYGNTEKVAKAIAVEIGSVALRPNEVKAQNLEGLESLIVGSPTQAFQPLKSMKTFLKNIPAGSLKDVKVASFDTRMDVELVNNAFLSFMAKLFGYAAEPMASILAKKGGVRAASPLGIIVTDKEGPLKDGEIERAVQWAKHIFE